MSEQPNLFAGVSTALAGLRDQIAVLIKTGVEEATRRMDMVKREEFDALAARVAVLEGAKPLSVAEPPKASDGASDEEIDKFHAG
jgi:BMFP domain-containing protein YqiC